ncbi:MAG TPA: RuBisCO large subunit C-terminal-like domain-containing protein [Anaeromyxobacteraceae bacterium]|nr:RuBisCO large subunit C-terminal-like domain-containing protein [Anaeromyxobacteraceae bacterium]
MEWLRVTYLLASSPAEVRARAEAVAVEQSVEMPVTAIRHPHVLEDILAKVDSIEPAGADRFEVVIRVSAATTGHEVSQLVNMLFGNLSIQEHVQLVDAVFPASLLSAFSGPRFGIAGLRERVRAWERPLTATALKPQGLTSPELATLCKTFALSGIDVVKDDHGIADQAYSPFAERVRACQRAVDLANRETGRATLYAPNLSGSPRQLFEQVRIVREEGVRAVLLAPMLIGLPVFQELVAERLDVPVFAHPSFSGVTRIAPPFLLGKLFRLFGADAVIFPNHGGRFAFGPDLCGRLVKAARDPWESVRPALPAPAGGMSVDRVDEMIGAYGNDVMLLIGGALLAAGDQLPDHSRQFVGKVEASARASRAGARSP